jgi:hypothetical protein
VTTFTPNILVPFIVFTGLTPKPGSKKPMRLPRTATPYAPYKRDGTPRAETGAETLDVQHPGHTSDLKRIFSESRPQHCRFDQAGRRQTEAIY